MKQTCQQCKWCYIYPVYHTGENKSPHSAACYYNGKWCKWLKKDSIDKPNACDKFGI